MKKVVIGAALAAVVALGWWSWPRSDAPPVVAQVAIAPAPRATSPLANATSMSETKVDAVRTAAAAPATRDEAFVVRVVDEREQPIDGADVRRWTAAGASAKQRTDRDGRAEFTPLDVSGGLLVRADGFAPLVLELALLRGEQRCTMPDGAILDGAMLVDGTPAPAGMRLRIHAPLVLPESAPRGMRDEFPNWRPSATALTAPGGTFVFRGLAGDRKVRLELPRTHWLQLEDGRIPGDPDDLRLRELLPGHRVLLHTTQLPTVHGRAVWADDGTPVCEPEATVFATFANGDGSPGLSFMGHDDGTFATGFYPASSSAWLRWCDPTKRTPLASVRMSVEAAGSEGSVRLDLDEKALATMPIEVRLPRAVITHFLVTDQDDRPIVGARVSATPSTPSDDHGRGTFQGKRDKVLVGADGYQVQPAVSHRPAAGTENDPLRFRLAPRNHLVLNVRTAAGEVAPVRFVRILSRTGHLFCGKRFYSSFDETFGGSDGYGHSSGRTQADGSTEYEWACTTRPDANGRVELHSLEPGVPCTVEASDSFGSVVATASFVMPDPGETCTIDLVVAGTPRTVRGRVVARDGTPLRNATVRVDRGSTEVRTGADGSFCFTGIYRSGPLRLTTKVAGYVEAEKEIDATDEGGENVLVLEPGQRVTLRVVDEQGRPVETDARAEQVPGRSLHPQTVQAGEHLFTDLPSGIVTFEVAFGGARFRVQHDTANPNTMLRVPRPGRIVVGPLKNGGGTDNLSARGTRLDAAGEPFYLRVGASDAEAELVVPGRYRVELIRVTWRGKGETRERIEETAAPAQEIEAKAGELVRIVF